MTCNMPILRLLYFLWYITKHCTGIATSHFQQKVKCLAGWTLYLVCFSWGFTRWYLQSYLVSAFSSFEGFLFTLHEVLFVDRIEARVLPQNSKWSRFLLCFLCGCQKFCFAISVHQETWMKYHFFSWTVVGIPSRPVFCTLLEDEEKWRNYKTELVQKFQLR
jgi:hypothetical protein